MILLCAEESSQPRICFQPPIPTRLPQIFSLRTSPAIWPERGTTPHQSHQSYINNKDNNQSLFFISQPTIQYTASLRRQYIHRAVCYTATSALQIISKQFAIIRSPSTRLAPARKLTNDVRTLTINIPRGLDTLSQCRICKSMAPLNVHCQAGAILYLRRTKHNLVRSYLISRIRLPC